MLDILLTSQALLWAIVIVLALVCLALVRQVGVLYERIAPMGALAMNRRLAGGDTAPTLSLTSLTGDTVTIGPDASAGQANSQLLFFLSPDCPVCKTLLPILKSIKHKQLDILLASDGGDPDTHRRFITKYGLEGFPYVLSEALGLTYGVSKLPYAVLINAQGSISALGIVNTREHMESLFEADSLGQATIQDYLHEVETKTDKHTDTRTPHEPA